MTKQHILEEIKRLAVANDGKPPGRLTFYRATGIREQDWAGKFWPRWSEAVQEAGFAPNALTERYKSEDLIEHLIALARELGKFPVSGELRMKAYSDKKFPSTKTYEAHFGSKAKLVEAVIRYCDKRSEFEDVLRFCEAVAPRKDGGDAPSEDTTFSTRVGFVYLMKSGRLYTIGRTNSVGRRKYEYERKLPHKPELIHEIRTDDPEGVEGYWLKRFDARRANGDWFDLSPTDVKAFKKWIRIA